MQETRPERQPLSTKKKILFYSIPIIFLLVIMECGLSLFEREALLVRGDDDQMVYAFYPERTGIALTPVYRSEVRIGQKGMRACQASNRTEAPLRVLALGDSFAEGWGVACEDVFSEQAEQNSGDVAVFNGGIHGGTVSYYILRNRVFLPEIEPDVLVVQLFDNDLHDLDQYAQFVTTTEAGRIDEAKPAGLGPLPAGFMSRIVRESSLYRSVRRVYFALRGQPTPIKYYVPGREPDIEVLSHAAAIEKYGGIEPIDDLEQSYNGQFAFYQYKSYADIPEDSPWHNRIERMRLYLEQLVEESREMQPGIEIVLVYIPARETFARGGIRGGAPGNPPSVEHMRSHNPFFQVLRESAAQLGLVLIDGQEVLRDTAADDYFPGDAHLTADGHRRIGQRLTQELHKLSPQ